MSQAQNPEGAYRALEGEYDLDLEVIGDIHATDIENYKEHLTDKYESGELDGILVTGDLTTNPALAGGKDGIEDLSEYKQLLDENVGYLDEIGDELDVDLYSVHGNHEPVKGAHPGAEEVIEGFEDAISQQEEEFSNFEGNYYEFLIENSENINDTSHGIAEIGDYTVVGGGSHLEPEVDPGALENAYETREIEVETENGAKVSDLVKGPVTGLATLGVAPFGKSVGGPKTVTEEYLPEEKREEFSDYFEKYDELEQLIEEAGDNIIALDHGVPYGSGLDTVRGGANKGSVVWRDLLEEHGEKITGFVGGHFHGGGEAELADVPIYNVGEGQYRQFGVNNGEIEHSAYDWEDIGGEAPPENEQPDNPQTPEQPQQAPGPQNISPEQRALIEQVEQELQEGEITRSEAQDRLRELMAQEGAQMPQTPGAGQAQAGT